MQVNALVGEKENVKSDLKCLFLFVNDLCRYDRSVVFSGYSGFHHQ